MAEAQKPLLADHIRSRLEQEFGSVPKAATQFGIPYERIKKALQRNSFGIELLHLLFPNLTPFELTSQFRFRLRRGYVRIENSGHRLASPSLDVGLALKQAGVSDDDFTFILEKKLFSVESPRAFIKNAKKSEKFCANFWGDVERRPSHSGAKWFAPDRKLIFRGDFR